MSKSIKFILIFIIVVLIFLTIYFAFFTSPKEEINSLDEVKDILKLTDKIYVCPISQSLNVPCGKGSVVRIIDDKKVIDNFINITSSLDELGKDEYRIGSADENTIYFIDSKGKVIISADFGYNYIIKTKKRNYDLSSPKTEELRALLKFEW